MKHKGLLVLFTVFLFIFAVSLGAQVYVNSQPSAWELEHQQWLQKEYGVLSIEELTAKYEREALANIQAKDQQSNDVKEHLLQMQRLSVGTSTYNDIQKVLDRLNEQNMRENMPSWSSETTLKTQTSAYTNFNFFTQLSIMSLSSMSLLGALFVPKIDKKLKGKHKFVLAVMLISIWVFFAGYYVGYAVAQSSEITIEKGSFQVGASYVIFQDGSTIKARDQWGNIAFSGADASTVIQSAINALTSGGKIFIKAGTYTITATVTVRGGVALIGEPPVSWRTPTGQISTKLVAASTLNASMIKVTGTGDQYFPYLADLCLEGNNDPAMTNNDGIFIDSVVRDMFVERIAITLMGRHGINLNAPSNVHLNEVYCEGNHGHGIYGKASNLIIRDSYIYGNRGYGIFLDGWTQITRLKGCYIAYNHLHGLSVSTPFNVIIIESCFFNANGETTGYANIRIWYNPYTIIEACIFRDERSPTVTKYHLSVGSSTSNVWIHNNVFRDGVSVLYNPDGAPLKIWKNEGFVTESSGTATVANNEYISHGLDSSLNIGPTNSTVLITPKTMTYDGVAVNVGCVAVNGTHIQIGAYWTNSTAITVDAIDIWWYVEYAG